MDTIDEDKYIINYIYTAQDENDVLFYIRRVVGKGKESDYLENYIKDGFYDNYVNAFLNDKLLFKIKYDYGFPFESDVTLFTEDYAPLFNTDSLLDKESMDMSVLEYKSILEKDGLCLIYRVEKGISPSNLQSSIKTILNNQLETKTFKQAYLFVGPAGTGKTTSARIFANMIKRCVIPDHFIATFKRVACV